MDLNKLFSHIRYKFKVWQLRFMDKHGGMLSYKGQYYIKYLMDYYINGTSDKAIEAYERMIDGLEQEPVQKLAENTGMPARIAAAAIHFTVMLNCMNKKTRAQYLHQIEGSPYFITILDLLGGI